MEVRAYEDEQGRCPFAAWFDALDQAAARKIREAVARMELGNPGDAKSVGGGVSERRISYGPDTEFTSVAMARS